MLGFRPEWTTGPTSITWTAASVLPSDIVIFITPVYPSNGSISIAPCISSVTISAPLGYSTVYPDPCTETEIASAFLTHMYSSLSDWNSMPLTV